MFLVLLRLRCQTLWPPRGAAVRRAHQASQVPSASARQVGAAPHVPVAGPSAGTGVAQPGLTAPGLDEISATIVADALAEALQEEGVPPQVPTSSGSLRPPGRGTSLPAAFSAPLLWPPGATPPDIRQLREEAAARQQREQEAFRQEMRSQFVELSRSLQEAQLASMRQLQQQLSGEPLPAATSTELPATRLPSPTGEHSSSPIPVFY